MNAVVAELNLAPGKSMRAIENVNALHINRHGLLGDREYMWVEAEAHTHELYKPGKVSEPGRFLSQREDPALTGVKPELRPLGLSLAYRDADSLLVHYREDMASNRIPVQVWDWEGEAIDQGDEAAEWGQRYIGRPVRLVALSHATPRYVQDNPGLGRLSFADSYPITVASTTSLDKINQYLAEHDQPPMPTNRPRANIILGGLAIDGIEGFPEDYIKSITVASNGLVAVLKRMEAISRCAIPDTDQLTGQAGNTIRPALGKLGRHGSHLDANRQGKKPGLFFTQGHIIELPRSMAEGEIIKIERGAEVEVEYSETTNWVRTAK